MGKKFLLSAIAVGVIASVASAGDLNLTITGADNDVNFTKEWVLQNSLEGNTSKITIAPAFVYTPRNIPLGSEKNPVLNVRFSNVKDIKVDLGSNALMVCEINASDAPVQDTPILKYQSDNGINGFTFVSYSPDGNDVYMSNGKRYAVFVNTNGDLNCSLDDNASLLTNVADANTTLTLADNAKTVDMNVTLGTGDSQQIHDIATGEVGKLIDQICCQVTTKLSAKINSGANFMAFSPITNSTCSSSTDKTDTLEVTCKDYSTDYGVTSLNDIMNIKADKNLPLDDANIVADKDGSPVPLEYIKTGTNDVNVTFANDTISTSAPSTHTYNVTLAVTGNKQIPVTDFTVDFGLDLNKNGKIDMYKLQNADAGSWTYNGTTLEIPYVVSSANTQTAVRLVNNSDVKADVYWTCTDDNGVVVPLFQVNSVDQNSTSIPANGAAAWLAKDILATARAKNPDFAPNGKMTCDALITTPSNYEASGVTIMTINGARDRVIPTKVLQ